MKGLLCGILANKYNVVSTSDNNNAGNNETNNNDRRTLLDLTRMFRERLPRISRPPETQATQAQRRTRCSFLLMMSGIVTIAVGCFVLALQPYDIIFRWKLIFSDGGETYEIWRKPPVELLLKVTLFNITNAEEYMNGDDEKINVVEVGPYVYRENLEHSNVTFNDNGTLTMIPKHPLVWVPELSNGREDDILTLPNIALLSIANVVKDKSYFTRMGLNLLIRQTDSQPLLSMTAREFMFGYKSPLVTLGNKFLKSWIPFDSLGLIDRMYNFDGDFSTIFTGEKEVKHTGLIDTYRGSTQLPQWDGDYCSRVQMASDATKFPSFIEPNDTLLFYRKSVCRSVPLVRIGEGPVDGLNAYHYTFEPHVLDNGKFDPRNKCFCRDGKCLQDGLIDVTECYYGFPIAVSFPHFYNSDPELLKVVTGSKPDKSKHESVLKIEPQSGLPLNVAVRFQINMALGDISNIARVDRFKDLILPMLWTEIGMERLPEDLSTLFKIYLNILPTFQQVSIYALVCSGSALLLVSVVRTFTRRRPVDTRQLNQPEAKQRRCSAYLDDGAPADKAGSGGITSKEMDLYYSSLLTAKESDIV